jgi:YebC/PmpR family DNA-binding regulatory protein
MSGHSKWSTIKHKKAKIDAERGKTFTKLIREITTAARQGGGDENANPRLRSALLAAKAANMPATNVERAVKKGTGELPGVIYEEKMYEGYGPGGVAVMVQTLTDNPNRTTSEVRHELTRHAGNMGEAGCVSWMFENKGLLLVNKTDCGEDRLMELVLDAGADDMNVEEETYEIVCPPPFFNKVKEVLESQKIPIASSEITYVPKTSVKVEGKQSEQVLRLLEALEELDDVQNVYANFDIDAKELGG